ncbi:MAG: preprotein translocase subunit SecE [Caldithrix sp.]|nr:preprotein translocase subunit SecE [Caldithrix sp.]
MFKKIQKFIEDVKVEMNKVSWPTRDELINSTIIVVVVSIIFTIFIFLADLVFSNAVQLFY